MYKIARKKYLDIPSLSYSLLGPWKALLFLVFLAIQVVFNKVITLFPAWSVQEKRKSTLKTENACAENIKQIISCLQ